IAPVTEVIGTAVISSISHALAENGVGVSNQNAVTAVKDHAAGDLGFPRCLGAVTPGLVGIGVLGVATLRVFHTLSATGAGAPINVVPLTTYTGRESQPAFSPDGNQIAFVWSGAKDDNTDVYVRLVDGGNWVRLTDDPGDDVNPIWSPDGRTIAFYRSS